MILFRVDGPAARTLVDADPAVRAGRFRVELATWRVPARVLVSGVGTLPRSIEEALGSAS